MKEKCDNNCATCPMQTQMHCVLVFCKANNAALAMLAEKMNSEQPMLLNPIDSVKHPTQEEDEKVKEEEL